MGNCCSRREELAIEYIYQPPGIYTSGSISLEISKHLEFKEQFPELVLPIRNSFANMAKIIAQKQNKQIIGEYKVQYDKKIVKEHCPPLTKIEILLEIPCYLNKRTYEILRKLGQYEYGMEYMQEVNLPLLGPFKLKGGEIYYGQFKRGKREGMGIQYWVNGSYYQGFWKNDMASGVGRLIHSDGDRYEGQLIENRANGHGKFYQYKGATYNGMWQNDKQNGYGVELWPDGTKYEGNYQDNKKCGKGKFIWMDNSYYEGNLIDNKIEGFGIYKWSDGRIYSGQWKNNMMHGQGEFRWPDGRFYKGQYQDDQRHGYGVYSWIDGRRYEGYWLNNQQHGQGVLYLNKHDKIQGQWHHGKQILNDVTNLLE